MFDPTDERCVICGGDGRIGNAFGATKPCPSCGGSGRRMEDLGHRDVTKTKTAQGRQPQVAGKLPREAEPDAPKRTAPRTAEGIKLAQEVRDCGMISTDTKTRLVREIIDYEISHGSCTKTFTKKLRKQLRPASEA